VQLIIIIVVLIFVSFRDSSLITQISNHDVFLETIYICSRILYTIIFYNIAYRNLSRTILNISLEYNICFKM